MGQGHELFELFALYRIGIQSYNNESSMRMNMYQQVSNLLKKK